MAQADGLVDDDVSAVTWQLGRLPRGVVGVAHRCVCGDPDVVMTAPRLPDGTPFPTLYYLTCPIASGLIGTLESGGLMREMEADLAAEPELADRYRSAHESYLAEREEIEDVPEVSGISAGGMPSRVKCLHVLAAHSLASGKGVNPLGDRTLAALPGWGSGRSCHRSRTEPTTA